MTTIYFIRHAQSDNLSRDDTTRPLPDIGLADTAKVTETLKDKGIVQIISSPHMRALQTVSDLAKALDIQVEVDKDFRERVVGTWIPDHFYGFVKKQWYDFNYRNEGGETLSEVQTRCTFAVQRAINTYRDKTIAVATHGTALATIFNHYDPDFGYIDVMKMIDYMPYIVKMEFDGPNNCLSKEDILIIERRYER